MKKIHEIKQEVARLQERGAGQLSAGFTILAPEQTSAFMGAGTNVLAKCETTNNCQGGNCVAGCGGGGTTTVTLSA